MGIGPIPWRIRNQGRRTTQCGRTNQSYIYNHHGGKITGPTTAITGIDVTITNEGIISGPTEGVIIVKGEIYNREGGTISGDRIGIRDGFSSGVKITNEGLITGGWAVALTSDVVVRNLSTGIISAPAGVGILAQEGNSEIYNDGLIEADFVINLFNSRNNLVTNTGHIKSAYYAVYFGSGDDRLVIGKGSLIDGLIVGGDESDTIALEDGSTFESASGFEKLVVSGNATITGASDFVDIVVNDAASLSLGNGHTTGSVTGNPALGAGATLTVNRSNAMTIGGVITGTGGIVQAGPGKTVLLDINSYSGATVIKNGTLTLGNQALIASSNIIEIYGLLDLSKKNANTMIDHVTGHVIIQF